MFLSHSFRVCSSQSLSHGTLGQRKALISWQLWSWESIRVPKLLPWVYTTDLLSPHLSPFPKSSTPPKSILNAHKASYHIWVCFGNFRSYSAWNIYIWFSSYFIVTLALNTHLEASTELVYSSTYIFRIFLIALGNIFSIWIWETIKYNKDLSIFIRIALTL